MSLANCASQAPAHCADDKRRELVRASGTLGGIDYVEVYPDGVTLCVHLFGRMPQELSARNVVVDGGDRIRGIRVLDAAFEEHEDGDTCLRVLVDRRGDFSAYCLCLTVPLEENTRCTCNAAPQPTLARAVPRGIDPRYACASFSFRLDCPAQLDCQPQPCASLPPAASPAIDYLARDFAGFRQLLLDRLALTTPQWRERHIPDLVITNVELLAWIADRLSYQLDAIATEAYLGTARLRISVRRHARLLDYRMHEGVNARALVTLELGTGELKGLPLADLVLAVPPTTDQPAPRGLLAWADLQRSAGATIFEAVVCEADATIDLYASHDTIHFYTWRGEQCCLPAGSRRATLLDQAAVAAPRGDGDGDGDGGRQRVLHLAKGDLLLFEEIRGAQTGRGPDADRSKRWAVRLTRVEPTEDPLDGTPLLEIEWGRDDALPFALCLSARTLPQATQAAGAAKGGSIDLACALVEVAVARGNVLLVDHGRTVTERNDAWVAGIDVLAGCCHCDAAVVDVSVAPRPFAMSLSHTDLTYATCACTTDLPASALCVQDPAAATASIALDMAAPDTLGGNPGAFPGTYDWRAVYDLLASAPSDRRFVAEVDDEGYAHLRFGDDDCGSRPPAGALFRARYRVGNGAAGNVGAEAIAWIALRSRTLDGVTLSPRNPLPASGGVDPETMDHVRQYAPHAYGRVLERAVTAVDYATVAGRDPRIQAAKADLAWTGTAFEADVALDVYARDADDADVLPDARARLRGARRVGHDLRIVAQRRVPLTISLEVCVAPGYPRAEVARAVMDVLSDRVLADGSPGLFHPDRLSFGQDVAASRIVAAVQALDGVSHVELGAFRRADVDATQGQASLIAGVIKIAAGEIAQLENSPDFPERGTLQLTIKGGR
jgi:hypothetical protein